MLVKTIAPSRISLFGGGTDTEPYASTYGGLVLNMAINLRQTIELQDNWSTQAIVVPDGGSQDFVGAFLKEFKLKDTWVDIKTDVRLNSGMGASATAAVALVAAIDRVKGLGLTKEQIAEKAWDIEVNKIGMFGGKQDQYAAALGGVNVLEFGKEVKVTQLSREFAEKATKGLLLFHTGAIRENPKIQEEMKVLTDERVAALDLLKFRVAKGIELIIEGDLEALGAYLDEAWQLKKKSNSKITSPRIDNIYDNAKHYGAYGGKLCGSGGGGYMIFIVNPNKKEPFIEKMIKEGLEWVDYSVDWNGVETRIL